MGISVSAKCGKKPIEEDNEDFLEHGLARTLSAGAVHNIPRLQIPSESNSPSDTECAETVVEEKTGVIKFKTITETSKPRGLGTFECRPQILNPEQASLSWTCDIFSKESDQLALGWASQINSESINSFFNGEPKEPKRTNYSPLVESDIQEPVSQPAHEPKLELIMEHVFPKPRDRKNFIRKNAKEVKATRAPKNGSYSQLLTARLQSSVEYPSNIESVSFLNPSIHANNQSTSPTVRLEHLLQEQRMDLIHAVDDFLRENSQETTLRSVLPEEIKAKPLSQPKIGRRPVKLVNFKNLDKYVKKGVKCEQLKGFDGGLHIPWQHEFSAVRHEVTSLQLPKSSEISIPFKMITPSVQEQPKPFSNLKKFEIVQSQDISAKAKSKREIMMEYSKSVSAANLVHNKKTISRTQTKPQHKLKSTLDEELAKILQVHEEETQRIASLFLS